MERRGVLRRSAVVGVALTTVTTMLFAATGGAAMADPAKPTDPIRGVAPAAPLGVVKDRYIVVLKDGKASAAQTQATAATLTRANGGTVRRVYTAAIRGYSAQMTEAQAKQVAKNSDVKLVEPVRRYSKSGTQTNPPSWGLDRVDQVTPVQDRSYTYPTSTSNVTAYVLDTGVWMTNPEFAGRIQSGHDFIDDDSDATDCHGHGTHVAGTVGGTTYGVAKNVNLVAVRVLDCAGWGTSEEIAAGVDWVTANAVKPAVANMSLGTDGPDAIIDAAVQASIASGVTYAVAAGNEGRNACTPSPARVPAAITVGATDHLDFRAFFSNYGPCVDLFAPGVQIRSAALGAPEGLVASGTSMASPHVAGAAALLLSANPTWTPQQVRDAIVAGSTFGTVQDLQGSPNRLLHVGALAPARANVGFRAVATGSYVTPGAGGSQQLRASAAALVAADRFDQVDAGNGFVALRSKANGLFVQADATVGGRLVANRAAIGDWEKFQVVQSADGSVSLRANATSAFVTADFTVGGAMSANRPAIGAWEKFEYVAPFPTIGIRAAVNGKYVVAENGGASPLIANRDTVGPWERFEISDSGDGTFALKAAANANYVSANAAGASPLLARATAVFEWEKFFVLGYPADGSFYLSAIVNGKAVTAPNGGASALIASRAYDVVDPEPYLGVEQRFYLQAVA
ncbi:S8 family serine peptidase [Micromonospora sp. NPDC049523]|uniref:S8 family serine peptidase n=1 Tax=Micromonospora sp. NPDC049523 TaxID=3155921 RepID=UPI00343EEBE1